MKQNYQSNIEAFKRQESNLILINISVLAALFLVHIGFLSFLGRPSKLLLIILAVRFILLIFELLWVQRLTEQTSRKLLKTYTYFSIFINISFAFVASYLGGTADSHYSVLMIIPVITAAYRLGLLQTILISGISISLTFLEVWLYFQRHPPADIGEYFEAATVSLIFLVVAMVVWLLVGNLRSEEQKLQESLEELQKTQQKLLTEEKLAAIGQLAGAIAHEIRNPVAMIASSLKMAEKQKTDSPVQQEMFRIATEEANRLETLTTDFLTFARTKEPEIKPVKIRDILEYIASLTKARLAEKVLTLNVIGDENLTAGIDSGQIQQALLNLMINAVEASSGNSIITLGAENKNQTLVIFVENNGQQIEPEIESKIFEPFFTAKPKGTGLGLAIVRKIARAHRGEIELVENKEGKIRFELKLPQRKAEK